MHGRAAPIAPTSARCPSGVCGPARPSFAAPQGPLMPPPRVVFFARATVQCVGRWPIPPRCVFPPPPSHAALAPPLAITRQPHDTPHHHTHRPGLWTGSRAPQCSRRVCGSSVDARSTPPPPHTHRTGAQGTPTAPPGPPRPFALPALPNNATQHVELAHTLHDGPRPAPPMSRPLLDARDRFERYR